MRYFHYIRKSTDDKQHQLLSLESQERENLKRFEGEAGIEILSKIEESKSAKSPGRALFNEMLDRIERGEAEGIIAWHPDRLARNSVDGGRIIYLLDTGKLKDLKFTSYTFENTASGKFMLQIIFANAKYQVDSLAINIRRGNRTKIEQGWRPNMAPLGYVNVGARKATTIAADPERFPIVLRLWEHMLTGAYTVPQLVCIARDEWGLRSRQYKKKGGKPLTESGMYWLFTNPFYAGILRHEGKNYPGRHPAMITLEDFEEIQRMLGRVHAPRPKHHAWDYTGLMKCACGRSITAEGKTNRFGSKYVYYHCARRRAHERCSEPYVQVGSIESHMREFLESVLFSPKGHAWALKTAKRDELSVEETLCARRGSLERALAGNELALTNLRHLRVMEQATEAEYLADRAKLLDEHTKLEQALGQLSPEKMIEPEQAFVLFNVRALKWFDDGDGATRRLLIEAAGSNPTLRAGKLKIDAAFPFRRYENSADIRQLCTVLNDVRTHPQPAAFGKLIRIVRILAAKSDQESLREAA